jgi:hypothetical protein
LRRLVAKGALLGFHNDGPDGVVLRSGDDDGVGVEVGGRTVIEVGLLQVRRCPRGERRAAEAGGEFNREPGILGEDRRD